MMDVKLTSGTEPKGAASGGLAGSLGRFAADIKLAHSVFALPFAASAFVIGRLPLPSLRQTALLLVCMVAARTFAMGMNRFLDRHVDLANPRTRGRMLPRGTLAPAQSLLWSLSAGVAFVGAACLLSPVAGACAAPLLLILAAYPAMKHLSWLTHWYLGLCLGLAPIGVAVALAGTVTPAVLLLGLAVALWTAGFDVLYALQDLEFDRQAGLHSVPSRFGPGLGLWISRGCFTAMVGALLTAGWISDRGPAYFGGVAVIAAILTYEHLLVRDARETGHSPGLNIAFFNANAYVSVVFLAFGVLDCVLHGA